jgi:hypothetical protein
MQPIAASETFPNGTGPAHPRALPMTRARRVALALGVPACLALIGWGAFAIVGEIGQGHFPVSAAIPVTGGTVTAHLGGGNVTADHTAGDLTLTTDGGDINGTGLTAARVTAGTGGGNVQIQFATVPGNVRVTSDGGNITIIVPRGATQYDVNASSAGGTVTDLLPLNTSSPRTITATTGGGNVTLREAP